MASTIKMLDISGNELTELSPHIVRQMNKTANYYFLKFSYDQETINPWVSKK